MSFNISTKIWRDIYMFFQKEILDFVMTFQKKKFGKNISKKYFIIMLLLYVELWRRKKKFSIFLSLSLFPCVENRIFSRQSSHSHFGIVLSVMQSGRWNYVVDSWQRNNKNIITVWLKKKMYTYVELNGFIALIVLYLQNDEVLSFDTEYSNDLS